MSTGVVFDLLGKANHTETQCLNKSQPHQLQRPRSEKIETSSLVCSFLTEGADWGPPFGISLRTGLQPAALKLSSVAPIRGGADPAAHTLDKGGPESGSRAGERKAAE